MDRSKKQILAATGKYVCLVLIIIFIVRLAAFNRMSKTDFQTMTDAVMQHFDTTNVSEGSSQMVKRLYGLDPADYDGVLLYYPNSNMDCEELILVKLKNTDQQDTVRTALQDRRETQLDNFDGYGTYQYGMLEKSVIEINGNYCLFVSAENADAVRQDFLNAL